VLLTPCSSPIMVKPPITLPKKLFQEKKVKSSPVGCPLSIVDPVNNG
jgi:hypothetical protein